MFNINVLLSILTIVEIVSFLFKFLVVYILHLVQFQCKEIPF